MTYLLERVNNLEQNNDETFKLLRKKRSTTPKNNSAKVIFLREARYTAFKHTKNDSSLLS